VFKLKYVYKIASTFFLFNYITKQSKSITTFDSRMW